MALGVVGAICEIQQRTAPGNVVCGLFKSTVVIAALAGQTPSTAPPSCNRADRQLKKQLDEILARRRSGIRTLLSRFHIVIVQSR